MKFQSFILASLLMVAFPYLRASNEPNPENAGLFSLLPHDILSRIADIAQEYDQDCDCGCCGKAVLEWKDICQAQATCKYMRKYFNNSKRIIRANFSSQRQPDESVAAFLNRVLVTLLKSNLFPHKNPIDLNLKINNLSKDTIALEQFIHNLDTFGIADQVIFLDLGENSLLKLPTNINVLKNLETLNFTSNGIGSVQPINFDEIGNIEDLHNLETLDLSWNNIKTLPDYFCTLPNLTFIDLSGNPLPAKELNKALLIKSLQGFTFQTSINSLPQALIAMVDESRYGHGLRYLNLNVNGLSKADIATICSISTLEGLGLYDYLLSELPDQISNLKKLESLTISCNTHDFEDVEDFKNPSLPATELVKLCKLEKLEFLYIDRLTLTTLPQEIEQLHTLRTLSLTGTSLPVQELRKICPLQDLKVLDLTGNALNSLPIEIINLRQLTELNLNFNAIPQNELVKIAQLAQLKKLSINNNQLTILPIELAALQHLEELDISGNAIAEDENYALLLRQLPANIKIINNDTQGAIF